jgi:hypothetical protein
MLIYQGGLAMIQRQNDLKPEFQTESVQVSDPCAVIRQERPTIPYTELEADTSDGPLACEWNFYLREVGRLLADRQEGKWVLIKGEEIIGSWTTEPEADRVRLERFLMEHVLLKQVLMREPVLRGGGYDRRWPN